MSAATGTSHLSHPWLNGPAERTVVQPWLTALSHQTLNAYAEVPYPVTDAPTRLVVVEALPAARPVGDRLVAAMAA